MSSKRKAPRGQLALGGPTQPPGPPAAPVPAEPAKAEILPTSLEYTPVGLTEKWHAERYDLLAVEFNLSAPWVAVMVQFHHFADSHTQTSTWFIIRRLFGIMPLIPSGDAHPDDMRTHTREELCAALHYTPEQIANDLEFFKAGWKDFCGAAGTAAIVSEPEPMPREELELDDQLLKKYQFSDRFFQISIYDPMRNMGNGILGGEVMRPAEENKAERSWFVDKLRSPEWQKMLDEPLASSLARAALLNELYLRRLQDEMMPLSPSSKKFKELQGVKEEIEKQYSDQLDRLQAKFPELGVAGRVSFRAVISDLNLAHRQYYGRKERRLWDKIHTAAEIQFLTRSSVQLPSARYRMGWSVAVVEAMNGLYDPNFRTQLKRTDLKKLDLGFKRGVEEARRETNEREVNLENGVMPGEGDDFDDMPGGTATEVKATV